MERYNSCTSVEKHCLDRLYEYLGFNEIVSFEEYLSFMFLNAKVYVSFPHIFNHTIKHIVTSFWESYPEYKNNYIKTFWIKPDEIDKFVEVGSANEFDPKGLVRFFIKSNFKRLVATKK